LKKCKVYEQLTVRTNGGHKCVDQVGIFKMLPIKMNYNQDSLVNIITMKDMASIPSVRITMDISIELEIIVEIKGAIFKCKECNDGLYYYNTDTIKTNNSFDAYSFLETVQSNKEFFTQQ